MEALGRVLNLVPTADGVGVSLAGATGVTFVCVGASDTYTVTSADSFAGSYADPGDVFDHYYANANADGSTAWTAAAQTASNAVAAGAGDAVVVLELSADSLPDGDTHVKCTSTSTGLVYAVVHGLTVQRKPSNLTALGA